MDQTLIDEIKHTIRQKLDLTMEPSEDEITSIIDEVIHEKSKQTYLSISKRLDLSKHIFNTIKRLDILQPYIEDPDITEIMVNGKDQIFIEKQGVISLVEESFESQEKLEDVIQQMVSKVNRVVNESTPIVDARLEDGSRVNVVLPPIAIKGPILTIRKFPSQPITINELIDWGTLTQESAEFLKTLIIARYNLFVCGGTSTGKTTFLNVLSNFIPKQERIITIEDSVELQIRGVNNLVQLETRNSTIHGAEEITIRELIKTSLRMRPDRIIVGEVRGPEALDMLQAMNTGHDGSLSTGHANSTKDMLCRLETMILTGLLMPVEAIRQQIASAIDVMIFLGRTRNGARKVIEIVEIDQYEDGEIQLNPLFLLKEGVLLKTNDLHHQQKLLMAGIKGISHEG